MPWKIEYKKSVVKFVRKLSPETKRRIRYVLQERIALLDNPRSRGKALVSDKNIWRYRVGDYRILV